MKIALAAALALVALASAAQAQDSALVVAESLAATPFELEAGVIHLVQRDSLHVAQGDTLLKLEGVPLDKDRSVGGLGLLASIATMSDMTGEQFWGVLEGPTSELPLTDPRPRFRVRLEKAEAHAIRLGKFAKAGKKRRARIDTRRPVDFFDGKYRIEHQVTKIGEGLWELESSKPLKAGEYALCLSDKGPAVDFTIIDEKGKK